MDAWGCTHSGKGLIIRRSIPNRSPFLETSTMKKLYTIGMLAALLLIVAPAMAPPPPGVALFADKDTQIGTVSVTDNGANLDITYYLYQGWSMNMSHVDARTSWSLIPQTKKGNAIPGKFQNATEHQPPVSMFTHRIPLPAFGTVYIAAHADVVYRPDEVYETEAGAWAGTLAFPGKDWDLYFTKTILED